VEERGTTYTFLSKKTGIKVDAISKSFSGKRRLPADEMVALCRVLNIDLKDLVAQEACVPGADISVATRPST